MIARVQHPGAVRNPYPERTRGHSFSELRGCLSRTGAKIPVIVIGGAQSCLDDYTIARKTFPNAFNISANQHAWRLGLDASLATCIDNFHTRLKQPMQDVMKQYGATVVSPIEWADYHLTEWRNRLGYSVGSGLMGILVGVMMGGAPVIPCGFTWQRKELGENTKEHRVSKTVGPNHPVRAVSGDLLLLYPGLDVPAEPSIHLDYLCMP